MSKTQASIEQLLTLDEAAIRIVVKDAYVQNDCVDWTFLHAVSEFVLAINFGDPEKQAQLLRLQTVLHEFATDGPTQGESWTMRSLIASFQENWEAAARSAEFAMQVYDDIEDWRSYGRAGSNCVNILNHAQQHHKADALAQTVYDKLQAKQFTEDAIADLGLFTNWGLVKLYLLEANAAAHLIDKAMSSETKTNNPDQVARFYGDLGCICMETEQFPQAESYLRAAWSHWQQNPSYFAAVNAFNLARLYHYMGRFSEALEMIDASVELHAQYVQDRSDRAYAVIEQAEILMELNQFITVEQQLLEVWDLVEGELRQAVWAWNMGLCSIGLENFEQAETYLQWCRNIFVKSYPHWIEHADLYLGRLYLNWGIIDRAPDHLDKAVQLFESLYARSKTLRPFRASEITLLLADTLLEQKRSDAAVEWLHRATDADELLPTLQIYHDFLNGKRSIAERDWATAERFLSTAWHDLQTMRAQIHTAPLKVGFVQRYQNLVQMLLLACFQQGKVDALWVYSEESYAHSFIQAKAQYRPIIDRVENRPKQSALQKQLDEKQAQWFRVCSQLYSWTDVADDAQKISQLITPTREAQLRSRLTDLNQKIADLTQRLDAQGVPNTANHVVTITELAATLNDETALVSYKRVGDSVIVLGITSGGLAFQEMLTASWDSIETTLTRFVTTNREEFAYYTASDNSYLRANYHRFLEEANTTLSQLYDYLWRPIGKRLDACRQVIIIPDDSLHRLPFQALHDGNAYLIDKHVISYAPSASLYVRCQQTAQQRRGAWGTIDGLFAHSGTRQLAWVDAEVAGIQAILGNRAQSFSGDDVKEETLKQIAPNARVFHIASHGEMQSAAPFLSYVEIASEQTGDSTNFHMYDMAQLNLQKSDLVVLSACETGASIGRGGDLLGLQWSVMQAGAYALIANMLPVEDYFASQLMIEFFKNYDSALNKAEALQQAQIALRNRSAAHDLPAYYAHPYFWAPCAIYGFADGV